MNIPRQQKQWYPDKAPKIRNSGMRTGKLDSDSSVITSHVCSSRLGRDYPHDLSFWSPTKRLLLITTVVAIVCGSSSIYVQRKWICCRFGCQEVCGSRFFEHLNLGSTNQIAVHHAVCSPRLLPKWPWGGNDALLACEEAHDINVYGGSATESNEPLNI